MIVHELINLRESEDKVELFLNYLHWIKYVRELLRICTKFRSKNCCARV